MNSIGSSTKSFIVTKGMNKCHWNGWYAYSDVGDTQHVIKYIWLTNAVNAYRIRRYCNSLTFIRFIHLLHSIVVGFWSASVLFGLWLLGSTYVGCLHVLDAVIFLWVRCHSNISITYARIPIICLKMIDRWTHWLLAAECLRLRFLASWFVFVDHFSHRVVLPLL